MIYQKERKIRKTNTKKNLELCVERMFLYFLIRKCPLMKQKTQTPDWQLLEDTVVD